MRCMHGVGEQGCCLSGWWARHASSCAAWATSGTSRTSRTTCFCWPAAACRTAPPSCSRPSAFHVSLMPPPPASLSSTGAPRICEILNITWKKLWIHVVSMAAMDACATERPAAAVVTDPLVRAIDTMESTIDSPLIATYILLMRPPIGQWYHRPSRRRHQQIAGSLLRHPV